jgi:hypothetical protein
VSDILLLLALLIVVLAALYLVAARSDLVASRLERMLRRGDPWGWRARLRVRLLAIKRAEPEPWLTEVQEAELGQYGDLYPPEAAEAPDREPRCSLSPDPVDEHFSSTAPFMSAAGVPVVPGDWTAELIEAYADYRAGRDIFAGAPKEH